MAPSKPGPVTRGIKLPVRGPRASLFQWREAPFWGFVLTLFVSMILLLLWFIPGVLNSPGGFLLGFILLLFYMIPMFFIIYFLDFYDREPLSLVVGALLWGGVVAIALAGVANTNVSIVIARLLGPETAANWSAALSAPFVEESLKACGVIMIYLIASREVDDIMDGFVYGAMVGLGFAVVEDMHYFLNVFGGDVAGVIGGFFTRVVLAGLYGHVVYSGLIGIGIAYFVTRKAEAGLARRWGVMIGLFAVAMFGHFLWNSPWLNFLPGEGTPLAVALIQLPLALAVKGLPFLAFLVVMIRLAQKREVYWLKKGIEAELGGPGLQPGELETLVDIRKRRRSRSELRQRAGRGAADLLKQIQREQIKLAMMRTRSVSPEAPDLVRQRQLVVNLRQALDAQINGRPMLPAGGPPGGGWPGGPPGGGWPGGPGAGFPGGPPQQGGPWTRR
jgi:RsiW-degrading membrane proteinase PrsW (M82 family)